MTSVVVPAHNEERTLARCLRALLEDRDAAPEIVVVCNGCTDGSARIARSFGPPVEVLELDAASKVLALNSGDAVARSFPRFYVDADVVIRGRDIEQLADRLRRAPRLLAVAPGLEVDASGASLAVQLYMEVWSNHPSVRDDIVGRGVYGLSEAGRQRFGVFPDLVADDLFVRSMLDPSEFASLPACRSVVVAPANVAALVRQKARVRAGNAQLRAAGHAVTRRRRRYRTWLSACRRHPRILLGAPVFALIGAVVRVRARWLVIDGPGAWGQDRTSR